MPDPKIYSNERFKEVRVEKTGEHTFLLQGKGQIFEAGFGWVVEDGHRELKKGFEMTDAGAPEWGNFSFTVDVQKERANSTLLLILFESSPKDGSRQYELPVVLY
ncbi:MAG: Gmad2 immunoglobulin-like domain-containing protein [Saprospiraceae bacterium]